MREREEIDKKDKWDLGALFKSDDEFFKKIKVIQETGKKFKDYSRENLNRELLIDSIKTYFKILEEGESISYYALLRYSENTSGNIENNIYSTYLNFIAQLNHDLSFFIPLLQKEETDVKTLLNEEVLKDYKRALKIILREKEHVLSKEEEAILSSLSPLYGSYEKIFSSLNNGDIKFKDVEGKSLTHSKFSLFLESQNENVRKTAYENFYNEFKNYENTLADLLIFSINKDFRIAKIRNFKDSIDMKLFANNINREVYENLINVVNANLSPLHNYYKIKAKFLKKEKLNHWDVYVPLIKNINFSLEYEEAVDLIGSALKILGNDYVEVLKNGLLNKWVDRYESKGKRAGAFSASSYNGLPYILLNYNRESIRDVFTLAHEAGHSMHSYYSIKNNPFSCYNYSIFEAEVASTVNEQLLADYMINNTDDLSMRKYIKVKQIDDLIATFFRQTMFAEFELNIHSRVSSSLSLTKDFLREEYFKLLKKYFGPNVEFNELASLECFRIPHFYSSFYVYQYATGISASLEIVKNILNFKERESKKYIEFLKVGGSAFALDALLKTGVDLSNPAVIKNTINIFEEKIKEIEEF